MRWSDAYDMLSAIVQAGTTIPPQNPSLGTLSRLLIRDARERFLAWILVCLVPWARQSPKAPTKATTKKQPSPAYLAAREGIKADNKICKVVESSIDHLHRVIDLKNATARSGNVSPEIHGQAIRAWGSEWRSVVMYALLTEVMEAKADDGLKPAFADMCMRLTRFRNNRRHKRVR